MSKKSVVFIDSRVADYQTIVAALPVDTDWFLLNQNSDGVSQIQSILAKYSGLDAIQIFSHGSVGAIQIGSGELSNQNIADYQSQLAAIGSSLTDTGDILLYGCNVAQGEVGQAFVETLADFTRADVAASTDLTGASELGGDWILESAIGGINSSILADNYTYLLFDNVAKGFIKTDFTGGEDEIRSIALQPDGKILVTGWAFNNSTNKYNFGLARYNNNGTLDTAFSGDGKLQTDFVGFTDAVAQDVIVQNDGKIVVVGSVYTNVWGNGPIALVRYNSDGSLDTSFGDNGLLATNFGLDGDSLDIQADGKIIVTGPYMLKTPGLYYGGNNFVVARFNLNGTLDSTFDGDGKVIIDFVTPDDRIDALIQPDGKIVKLLAKS